MVYLNRIYTRSGDDGLTALGTGQRVTKTHQRIIAYGGVDELNAVLGLAMSSGMPESVQQKLQHIQNDLFDLGADLCIPESGDDDENSAALRVTPHQVETLEEWIDEATEELQPLESFILPGGSPQAAHLHLARTVCRRIEIGVVELAQREEINPSVLIYLNRLSDLLFVLARQQNDNGRDDVLWKPGQSR